MTQKFSKCAGSNEDEFGFAPLRAQKEVTEDEYRHINEMSASERALLMDFLKDGVIQLQESGSVDNPDALLDAVLILGHHQEPDAFRELLKLEAVGQDVCENAFGEYFIFEDWPHLLSATAHGRWNELKSQIQNNDDDYFFQPLLKAAENLVLDHQVSAETWIRFVKENLQQAIRDKDMNVSRLTDWVESTLKIGPGECLEEIKELYGLRLVDESDIDIDYILEKYHEDLLRENRSLEALVPRIPFVVVQSDERQQKICDQMEKMDASFAKMNKLMNDLLAKEIEEGIQKERNAGGAKALGRNEACFCGSGKKYKHCCLQNEKIDHSRIRHEEFYVSYEQIRQDEMENEDEIHCAFLHQKMTKQPEECIDSYIKMIEKYPFYPSLYNHLYLCYTLTKRYWEAQDVLKKTVELFPDYLFGKIECASYLMRRGEYDQIPEIFRGSHTLKQLYPDRNEFHVSEMIGFHYTMGLYFIKIANLAQANMQLSILEKLDRNTQQAKQLKREISIHVRRKAIKEFKMTTLE